MLKCIFFISPFEKSRLCALSYGGLIFTVYVFGAKEAFAMTTYIEVWGHMITQNDALDEYKQLCYRKFFGRPKNGPLGPKMTLFGPKFKFWPKMAIFCGPKIFKKICFAFLDILFHS